MQTGIMRDLPCSAPAITMRLPDGAESARSHRARFPQAFEEVDAVVAPVSPFPHSVWREKVDDPWPMYLSDIFTITGSLAGIPA